MENWNLIKAVIFDLDGVIISTDEYHYLAWKRLADETGLYFDRNMNSALRGVSRLESLNIILSRQGRQMSETDKLQLTDKKNSYYKEYLEHLSSASLTEDTANALTSLRKHGYLLAIGSSSKNARLILDRIGCGTYFDVVVDGNDIKRSKPDPEVFELAAKRLGIFPENCIVVEDSEAGIEAAVACGMRAAAVGYAAKIRCGDWNFDKLSEFAKKVV
ncbi:beta-phosphoglucomutase [uncultured Clostridium sp.]|jgi:beta-phosphoglucomutase|uniref:beta-phosphoglucomutase n=1 Tax=Lacrimispora sp. TaxID=2719234 RepID=UPI00259783A9|nr:beta-phosphoglucomutase [uncultured Clostridium sp.]MDK2964784.1 beta-phosphoglucomutase [Lacrimispora sp.]